MNPNAKKHLEKWINRQTVTELSLSVADWNVIADFIYYGGGAAAQREYEFVNSEYDEDAGVFTDYGKNSASRTWANVYMIELLTDALVAVDYPENGYEQIESHCLGWVNSKSVPAITHLLSCMLDEKFQTSVWQSKIRDDYDSDGHYEKITKQEYYDRELQRHFVDKKRIRKIIDTLSALPKKIALNSITRGIE